VLDCLDEVETEDISELPSFGYLKRLELESFSSSDALTETCTHGKDFPVKIQYKTAEYPSLSKIQSNVHWSIPSK
jgi:hypothetical protein